MEKRINNKIFLGSHVGMKAPHYYLGSVEEALFDGATTLMLYTGAPQNTYRTEISKLKIEEALNLAITAGLDTSKFICHAPYLINLANTINPDILEVSQKLLLTELSRCQAMGIKTIVLHPGSHVKMGIEVGLEAIIKNIDEVLAKDNTDVVIALETMPGAGSQVGGTLEEIAYIIKNSKYSHRFGVCLDTCHLYSSGLDVRNVDESLRIIDEIIGINLIKCVHLNDSQHPFDSHKDRHANVGHGVLGFDVLYNWVHHPKLEGVPFILETPYVNDKSPYKKEIAMLLSGDYEEDWINKL